MTGFAFLDLVIGLIFIYLIYSLACSTIWEIAVNFTALRGSMLNKWFLTTFDKVTDDDELFAQKILGHPMVRSLSKSDGKMPSYIPSRLFSDVLVDLVANLKKSANGQADYALSETDIARLKEALETCPFLPKEMRGVLLQYVSEAEGKIESVKKKIALWYEDAMDRVGGSFKKRSQRWILLIATVLVGFTNADSLRIVTYLYDNPAAREAIANKAALYVQDSTVANRINELKRADFPVGQKETLDKINTDLKALAGLKETLDHTDFPLGWNTGSRLDFWGIIKKIGGLIITAMAVSMGAPFWFDMLNKLVNLRSSGAKPESAKGMPRQNPTS